MKISYDREKDILMIETRLGRLLRDNLRRGRFLWIIERFSKFKSYTFNNSHTIIDKTCPYNAIPQLKKSCHFY
jgi:hypothetical protein